MTHAQRQQSPSACDVSSYFQQRGHFVPLAGNTSTRMSPSLSTVSPNSKPDVMHTIAQPSALMAFL